MVNTDAYENQLSGADTEIKTILASNLGRPTHAVSSR
jgi:hypothetical protein